MRPFYYETISNNLSAYLKKRLDLGHGLPVLERIQKSKCGPSKKLLQEISKVIKENKRYTLLDTQLIAFDKVMNTVRYGLRNKRNQ
jgi:hypothetical protein